MCNRGILFLLISSSSRSSEAWSPEKWIPARSHLTMLQRLLEFRRPLMPKVIKTPNKLTDIKRNKYPSPSPPQAALCSWVNLLMSLKKPLSSVLPTKGSVCVDLGASLAPQLQVVNTVLEIKMLKCPLFGEQRLRAAWQLRGCRVTGGSTRPAFYGEKLLLSSSRTLENCAFLTVMFDSTWNSQLWLQKLLLPEAIIRMCQNFRPWSVVLTFINHFSN